MVVRTTRDHNHWLNHRRWSCLTEEWVFYVDPRVDDDDDHDSVVVFPAPVRVAAVGFAVAAVLVRIDAVYDGSIRCSWWWY